MNWEQKVGQLLRYFYSFSKHIEFFQLKLKKCFNFYTISKYVIHREDNLWGCNPQEKLKKDCKT